jgi:hypothetical protein
VTDLNYCSTIVFDAAHSEEALAVYSFQLAANRTYANAKSNTNAKPISYS